MRKFIAVYIDLENVAAILDLDKMLQDIILEERKDEAEEYVFAVKFACGNSRSISKIRKHLIDHNFEIREAPHVAGKKNRADLIISLDAFEKLYLNKPEIDHFVFVTSDSDFSVIMDLLRKYGKEVWLITREGDENRPIFTNCTDNIIVIPEKERPAEKRVRKTSRAAPEKVKNDKVAPTPPSTAPAKNRDRQAEALFKKVLLSLDHSSEHMVNSVSNKMRQLDKSFKIKNTSFKKMTSLVKKFEADGTLKTKKSPEGHQLIYDLEI